MDKDKTNPLDLTRDQLIKRMYSLEGEIIDLECKLENSQKYYQKIVSRCHEIRDENKQLSEENQQLARHNSDLLSRIHQYEQDMPILTGDEAKQFEEYNNKPLTEEERKSLEEALEFYKSHDKTDIELRHLRKIKEKTKKVMDNPLFTMRYVEPKNPECVACMVKKILGNDLIELQQLLKEDKL